MTIETNPEEEVGLKQSKQQREQVLVHVESLEEAPAAVSGAQRAAANDADEEGEPAFLTVRLSPLEQSRLDTVLGWLASEPPGARRQRLADYPREKLSYAGALRFALRRCTENPPAHVVEG